jgi:hypothetical protein
VREFLGSSVPESLKGEPSSLRSDVIRSRSSVVGNVVKKRAGNKKKST